LARSELELFSKKKLKENETNFRCSLSNALRITISPNTTYYPYRYEIPDLKNTLEDNFIMQRLLLKSAKNDSEQKRKETENAQKEQKEILKTPGFEIYYGIASLLTVLLYKRK